MKMLNGRRLRFLLTLLQISQMQVNQLTETNKTTLTQNTNLKFHQIVINCQQLTISMCLFICLFIATQNFYYTYANGSETQGLKQFSKLENNLKGGKDYLENELLPNITCNVLSLLSV